jgi:hypothetical protein
VWLRLLEVEGSGMPSDYVGALRRAIGKANSSFGKWDQKPSTAECGHLVLMQEWLAAKVVDYKVKLWERAVIAKSVSALSRGASVTSSSATSGASQAISFDCFSILRCQIRGRW